MSEELNSVGQPQVTPELELEINLDESPASEAAEELKARLVKEVEARKQLTARAKEEQAKRKALEAELAKYKQPQTNTQPTEPHVQLDEITDLRLDGYTRDEVAFIMKNGGRKSLESDSFVKVAIEQIREQKKAENAIPANDTGKSDIERKYTKDQLAAMSVEELTKILPKSNR